MVLVASMPGGHYWDAKLSLPAWEGLTKNRPPENAHSARIEKLWDLSFFR